MTNPVLTEIAAITSAHGVRGQVKLKSFTDPADAVFKRKDITDKTGTRRFKLRRDGVKDALFIVTIEGVADRNAAELLKGTALYAPAPKEKKKAGSWTYAELTGLEARTPDGRKYGTVTGVYNFGAGDIVEIELQNGASEMLPFKDEFIGDVCADEGFLIAHPPEYVECAEAPDEPPEPDAAP